MIGEYKNSEIVLDNFVSIRAPRTITVLSTMIVTGIMEHDRENNKVTVTYRFTVSGSRLDDREYKITASHSLDLTKYHNGWCVTASAETSRRRKPNPLRKSFTTDNRNGSLNDVLDDAAKWIGEQVVEFGLENLRFYDPSWETIEEEKE